MNTSIPIKTIERLIVYKRLLQHLDVKSIVHCFSHELAALAHNSSAQVRRDLMQIGYNGSPRKGYSVKELIFKINETIKHSIQRRIALVGVGNLGRAILSYFSYQQPNMEIVAAFDSDPDKIGRVIAGCRCYDEKDIHRIVQEKDIRIGIITAPASQAQKVAGIMVEAGILGILNFAPLPVRVPDYVSIDQVDISMKLEKLAYLSCQ